ncbi:acyl-CoA N-acyltransferase [Mycena latifolia]|nr:acyl-CoA N-acyltransferase [Mycena latifolia]
MAPYEHNFCFPVPEELRSARVRLTPFVPETHAAPFFAGVQAHPEIFTYLSWGPFTSAQNVAENFIEARVQPDAGVLLFTVWDISNGTSLPDSHVEEGGAFAGVIGVLGTSPAELTTEIGFVVTLPRFRRTHITSHVIGLLLHWALDLPSDPAAGPSASGLGLRRVVWRANARNTPSIRAAERMGFRREGVARWDRVLPRGKPAAPENGVHVRAGDARAECAGLDSQILALCWDEWEGGVRETVDAVMARSA